MGSNGRMCPVAGLPSNERSLTMMMALMTTMMMMMGVMGVNVQAGDQIPPECNEDELFKQVYSCFSSRGLQLPLDPGVEQSADQLLKETQTMDPDALCQHRDVYKGATNCTLGTLGICLKFANMEGAIPDIASFHRGMDVLCERKNELNTACLKSQHPHIVMCGTTIVQRLVQSSSGHDSIDEIICLSADVNYDCASEHLKNCGERTQHIFLELLDKYQVPTACVDQSPGRPGRKRYTISGSGTAPHSSVMLCLAAAVVSLRKAFTFP